jgi:hypothetical protein
MLRKTVADPAIDRFTRTQMRLATTRQLRAAGLSTSVISRRCAPAGPWQRVLPGVVLIQTGSPDRQQRLLAGVLYAVTEDTVLSGTTAVLTGEAALALYGVRDAAPDRADVLVAAGRGLGDRSYVRLCRTGRWPPTLTVNGIPCVRPVRAASDFAVREPSAERVRALLANTIQKTGCHPEDLHTELRASHAFRNRVVRPAITELRVGIRSIAEGECRAILLAADLPPALWNPTLLTEEGVFIARPDAYWPEAGLALEVDSEEFHLGVMAYRATLRRRLLLESHGVDVISAVPALVRDHPQELVAAVRVKLQQAGARPTRPTIQVRPLT